MVHNGIFPKFGGQLEVRENLNQIVPKMERTVKVIRVNHPDEIKYITPAAVQYLDTKKWILAEPVPVVAKKKDVESAVIKRVVPKNVTEVQPEEIKQEIPVVIPEPVKEALEVDPKDELRVKFKELSGQEADGRWNVGRLNIEISKLQKA